MMKKITALLLALVLCFTLCACSSEKKDEEPSSEGTTVTDVTSGETTETETTEPLTTDVQEDYEDVTAPSEPITDVPDAESEGATPLLYKVSDAEGNVIWLFGSIHVGKEEFYPLPDYVMNAYNSSDALAVEANVLGIEDDTMALMNAMKPLIYTDGTTIKDHVSEQTYTAAVDALTGFGLYNAMLDYYRPAMWWNLIESAIILETGVDATLGIDMYFLSLATDEGKEIEEIESVAFQYSMLAEFSPELQEELLASVLVYIDETELYAQELNELMDLWAEGDEEAIGDYLSSSDEQSGVSEEIYEEYNTAMIIDRNNNMTDYAVDALASGEEVFICVGAAHVVGEGAIADNLREKGYTVEVVR